MNPYVKSVQPKDDHCLLLTFENGEKRVFDLKPYLNKPVFARLKNIALFKTVRAVSGSVEWQGEIDLSYDTLYLESKAVKAVKASQLQRQAKKTRSLRDQPLFEERNFPKHVLQRSSQWIKSLFIVLTYSICRMIKKPPKKATKVTVRRRKNSARALKYPLRGKSLIYRDPFKSASSDWEAIR